MKKWVRILIKDAELLSNSGKSGEVFYGTITRAEKNIQFASKYWEVCSISSIPSRVNPNYFERNGFDIIK